MPAPGETPDEHDTKWTVIGVLKPTHTAADRAIYIPLQSFYAVSEHEKGLEEQSRLRGGLPAEAPAPKKEEEHHDDEQQRAGLGRQHH